MAPDSLGVHMTLSIVPEVANSSPADVDSPWPPPAETRTRAREASRRWAVVEIYGDGTLSMPRILMGADPTSVAEALPMGQPLAATLDDLSPALQSHLGRSHAATGQLLEAARALAIGARAAAASTARERCLGQLALVEAFRGDLRRADARADLVLATTRSPRGTAPCTRGSPRPGSISSAASWSRRASVSRAWGRRGSGGTIRG